MPRHRLPTALLAALTAGATPPAGRPTQTAAPAQAPASGPAWAGTYDLVGTGFSDGARRAVLVVARQDTTFALTSMEGPPGKLESARFTGDSAHVRWALGPAEPVMDVRLRVLGDSLTGTWVVADQRGPVSGRRRR